MITRLIHRLIAEVFVPNPNNYTIVNHIDGIKSNNISTNLEWVTPAMNSNLKVFPAATRKGRAVVQCDTDLNKIKTWESAALAARELGITPTNIGKACRSHNVKSCGYFWRYEDEFEQKDDEIWRPWELGSVSDQGRIRSARGAIVLGSVNAGYLRYNGRAIHRIVATAFPEICPRVDGSDIVNHKDGIRHNNVATNLEWTTSSGNSMHAYNTGLNSRRREVCCISTGQIYISVSEAARQTGAAPESIIRSCKSAHRVAAGLRWTYANAEIDQANSDVDSEADDNNDDGDADSEADGDNDDGDDGNNDKKLEWSNIKASVSRVPECAPECAPGKVLTDPLNASAKPKLEDARLPTDDEMATWLDALDGPSEEAPPPLVTAAGDIATPLEALKLD